MNLKTSDIDIENIMKLPALKNMIRTHSDLTGLSFTIYVGGRQRLWSYQHPGDLLYGSIAGSDQFNATLRERLEPLTSTSETREIEIDGLAFFLSPLAASKKIFAWLLCGPFLANSPSPGDERTVPLKAGATGDLSSAPVVMKKERAHCRKIIRTTAELIAQVYTERLDSLTHASCLYSSLQEKAAEFKALYKIGTTIGSSMEMKKVLSLVLDSAIELLGAQNGSIMLLEDDREDLRIFVANGLSDEIVKGTRVKVGEGISGGVARTGKPRLLLKGVRESNGLSDRKKAEIKTAMCVPLKLKGRVTGVLNISGRERGGNFSKKDLGLLEILASHAAIAIHNARLYLRVEEKAGELEALYGIGTIITSSMEKRKVLYEVLRSSMKLLKAKKGSFMMIDREKDELAIEIAHGLPKKILKTVRPKLGEGIAGKVALEGKPRLMEKGIRVSGSKTETKETEIPSAISVPVKVKENTIGVLNVSDKETGDNFTTDELALLMMLANQAAIAIENSRLMEELQELFVQSITALANAIDARDPYTRGHSQRVTEYSLRIARKLGMTKEDLDLIQYAALLHDIGKIHIRDDILHKPGRLTDDEYEEMQKHPAYGAKIMEPVKRFNTILPYMYHHHEKFAGKGYPFHLKGNDIPLAARIISVADSFDAMTSDRPYRKGLPVEQAVAELKRCAGTQFDPEVVDTFLRILQHERSAWLKRLLQETM